VLEALLFGALASSALVIGGVVGALWRPPGHLVATALAFASGALISALAFELFDESFRLGGGLYAGAGLLAGAATFVVIDTLLERRTTRRGGGASGYALLAGVTLDGVPENLSLGLDLVHGPAFVLLVGIFASNLPEALAGARSMREQGRSARFASLTWAATGVLLALAVVLGRGAFSGVSPPTLAVMLAFAGGAVLASLAATIMPDAYRGGGPAIALATAVGFLLSYLLAKV
jgi:ZIP family zinc transporter